MSQYEFDLTFQVWRKVRNSKGTIELAAKGFFLYKQLVGIMETREISWEYLSRYTRDVQ